jgi:hypothetical protein
MPIDISNAVNKHNHGALRLRLSKLRLRLSRIYGYAYRAVVFTLFGGLTVMLMMGGVALGVILLAVLMG